MNAINIIPIKTDSCPIMGDKAIVKKMNVSWSGRKRGDIVLFDFNHNKTSDHIGIVISVNKDGTITTIEGNTGSGNNTNGGQVQMRTRYKSQVNFFVRPKYNKEVTADMVIATAKAELGTKESPKNSNKVKYNRWFYGSNKSAFWCCTFVCWLFAHVEEIKPIEKPKDKYGYALPNPTLKKGSCGTRVKELQRFLNWYCTAKLERDGEFGSKTEHCLKVFQVTEGLDPDGVYGKKSYTKAKEYLPEETVKPETKADKIIQKIDEFAYPYGTPRKKWSYKSGTPRHDYAVALKKYMKKTALISKSDCGYFVSTAIRASGVSKTFLALAGRGESFPKCPSTMKIVHKGKKIPSGLLKPGDVIRYKKNGGGQHTLMYYGNGKIAEAGRKHYFPAIKKDTKKYNKSNVKHKTLQVLRAKE